MLRLVLSPCPSLDQKRETVNKTPVPVDRRPSDACNQIMPLLVCIEDIQTSVDNARFRSDAVLIYAKALLTDPAAKLPLIHNTGCGAKYTELFVKYFVFYDGNSMTIIFINQPVDLFV